MHIILYRSILCPRCFMAGRYLREIAAEDTSIVIEEVDVMQHPQRTWKEGIRCIPALRIRDTTLSGIYLNKEQIRRFIQKNQVN
ncbi:hypothetical protein [Desulfopila inferna]|uniref:hypothetical protein n=1 Tax=Desulfopila inferna TaxID=468528 RepID=UPI0019623CBB|nr:hypothetical protein [Desulfopila inferna]MBM9605818.1 hypothetical protein [Desulfopila inferna]